MSANAICRCMCALTVFWETCAPSRSRRGGRHSGRRLRSLLLARYAPLYFRRLHVCIRRSERKSRLLNNGAGQKQSARHRPAYSIATMLNSFRTVNLLDNHLAAQGMRSRNQVALCVLALRRALGGRRLASDLHFHCQLPLQLARFQPPPLCLPVV